MTISLTKKYFILLLVLTIIGGAFFVFPLRLFPYYIPSFAIPFIITIVFLVLGFAKQNLKYIKIAQYCTFFLGASYLIEGIYMFIIGFRIAFLSFITALPSLLVLGFCVFSSFVINIFILVMFTKFTNKLDISNNIFKNIGFVMIIIGLILVLLTPINSVGTGIDFMKDKHISLVRLYFIGLYSETSSFKFIYSVGALEYFFTGFVMFLQNWKKKISKVEILEKLYRLICLALTILSLVILFSSFSVITVDEKDLFTILFIDKYGIDSRQVINIIIYVYILCFGALSSLILSIMVIFKNTPVLRKILGFINIVFAAVILTYIKPNDSLFSFITLPSILLIAIGLYNLFTYYKDTYKEINVKKILHTSLVSILILLLLISSYSNYYLASGLRINNSSSNFYNVFVVIYYSIIEFGNIVRLGAFDFGLIPSSIILFLFIVGEITLYKIVKKKTK